MLAILRKPAITVPTVVSNGLVALYLLDEGSGQDVLDSSGNGHDGTLGADDQASTDDPAWGSGALAFDGGDHVALGTAAALRPAAFTVSAAVRMTAGEHFPILGWHSGNNVPAFYGADPGFSGASRPLLFLGSNNFRYWQAATPVNLQDGEWHFLAVTCPGSAQADISSATLRVDGLAQTVHSTTASAGQAAKNTAQIGMAGNADSNATGSVALLALHNRVLEPSELARMRAYAQLVCAGKSIVLP